VPLLRPSKVVSRGKISAAERTRRVGGQASALLQTAAAAAASYGIATYALGHAVPIFAAISAVIVLGAVRGQEPRRALEVTAGVVVGVTIADVLVLAIGTGIPQIALIVVLAMVVAVFVGAGPVLMTQAAVSASMSQTTKMGPAIRPALLRWRPCDLPPIWSSDPRCWPSVLSWLRCG